MSKIIFNGVDYAGGSGNYFNPVIYSDVERKVGVWRDNKPLYQKTVHISALPSSAGSQQYAHNIANIDKICNYYGIGRASSGSTVILNRAGMSGSNLNGAISYDCFVDKTVINISVGQDRSGIEADVTIWYTKTTDTAGSGDYNTLGVPTVHYSTSEQVIGTWIDGKPLYQKTWIVPKSSLSSGETTYTHNNDLHIDNLVSVEGAVGNSRPLVEYHSNSIWACSIYNIGNNAFWIYLGSSVYSNLANTSTVKVTLRYTKTTD